MAGALGHAIRQSSSVGGGDVAEAFQVQLANDRTVFVKFHSTAPPDFFSTEATGLEWLRDGGTLPIPEVLAVSDENPAFLVLEWIDVVGGRPDDATFGRELAALHRAGAPAYGRQDRRTTGSRRLPNEPTDTWAEFYAANRLRPLARLAADAGALPPATIAELEAIAERLHELGPEEAPARLHGDLWAGNRVVDAAGRSWLVDPAAHGGHREFDLAMMRLFGGFGEACFAGYQEVWPLADGWEDRVLLHQLAPLAVHAIKFGDPYVEATAQAAHRYR